VDQQGVVFNMWYLAYFDDAMTAWLAHRGVPYQQLFAAGLDVQLVHTEVDWRGAVGFGDDLTIGVSLAAIGRTSLTLDLRARREGTEVVTDEPSTSWSRPTAAASGRSPTGCARLSANEADCLARRQDRTTGG
jgi:YbgC/YbaW family acyl-CoA thioester hydrolase